MSDDLPPRFERLTPRAAPNALRARVLRAVDRELTIRRKPRWERTMEIAVAAALLIGLGLNLFEYWTDEAFQDRLFGPPAIPNQIAEIAQTIQLATDAETARQLQRPFLAARRAVQDQRARDSGTFERSLQELSFWNEHSSL